MQEIVQVPPATLHREAAFAWGNRAVASYRVCAGKSALQECLSYFYLGEHYREAALAHASMGEQWQPLGNEVEATMAGDRARAFAAMQRFTAPLAGRRRGTPAAGKPASA